MKTVARIVTWAVASASPLVAGAQPLGPDIWHGRGWGWGHMVFGSLMMLLFWAVVVLAVVFAVRWANSSSRRREPPADSRALGILDERFARGEIDRDEFEERKRVLEGRASEEGRP